MSNLYDDFEKRFTDKWFSSGWAEVETKQQTSQRVRKDLATLQAELDEIQECIENVAQKTIEISQLG